MTSYERVSQFIITLDIKVAAFHIVDLENV